MFQFWKHGPMTRTREPESPGRPHCVESRQKKINPGRASGAQHLGTGDLESQEGRVDRRGKNHGPGEESGESMTRHGPLMPVDADPGPRKERHTHHRSRGRGLSPGAEHNGRRADESSRGEHCAHRRRNRRSERDIGRTRVQTGASGRSVALAEASTRGARGLAVPRRAVRTAPAVRVPRTPRRSMGGGDAPQRALGAGRNAQIRARGSRAEEAARKLGVEAARM